MLLNKQFLIINNYTNADVVKKYLQEASCPHPAEDRAPGETPGAEGAGGGETGQRHRARTSGPSQDWSCKLLN